MKKMNLNASVSLVLAAALTSATASPALAAEGVRVAVAGIAGVTGARNGSSNPAQGAGLTADRKIGYGAGALIEFPFSEGLGIETGALYVQRKFEIGNPNFRLTRSVPTVFVPLEARLWLGNFFSVAGGAFGALRVSSQSDEVTSGSTTLASISSGNRESTEFGATAAATLNLAAAGKSGLFIEARYNRGFSNASKDGIYDEHIDDLLVLAGLRFDAGN